MTWKAVILFGLALGSQAIRIPISDVEVKKNVGLKAEHRKELIHIGSEEPEHHEEYAWAYPSYEFSYSVNDPHTHDNKGQHEKRHGDEVTGEYWLLQPDGKKRTVKYQADKHKGFNAHVHYADHHHEEPHHEDISKPVEEHIGDEPPREVEMSEIVVEQAGVEEQKEDDNIDIEEQKEEPKEEPEEEQQEKQVEHKPRGATHIEYYVLHKYRHDGHEIKHESKEETHEEHHEPIKHHTALPVEIISKVHHPIHNEHHGHVHEKHHHQIHYKPLISYNYHKHHKVPSHKSPVRLTLISDEKKEHHSEEVSEPQAERKHHVEHAYIPPLRPYMPVIHRQHNKEHRRHHYRSIAQKSNTKQ